jgi:hypothetical protein
MGLFGFGEKETIVDLVNELPESGITVMSLRALDFVVPEQWRNYTNFDEMLREVTGEEDEEFLESVKNRVIELYNDSSEGYQSAMKLYRLVDKTDKALGASAFADKISEKISLLSFLDYLTPKADISQVIDLSLKLIVELIAFTKINGIPGDSIGDFIGALGDYAGESKIRMAALVSFDGILPLGPDFISYCLDKISGLTGSDIEENDTFDSISDDIPGDDSESKLDFIKRGFEAAQDWMSNLMSEYDLSTEKIIGNLQEYVDVADDKLDYIASFLDMLTNYFEHTGTQTLAIRMIERAVNEV